MGGTMRDGDQLVGRRDGEKEDPGGMQQVDGDRLTDRLDTLEH